MEFKDLKVGTIIKYDTIYCVVLGISDYIDYENRFIKFADYENMVISAYKLVEITYLFDLDNKSVDSMKAFLNSILTSIMKEKMDTALFCKLNISTVDKVDMRVRTKDVTLWMMKNKVLNPDLFAHTLNIEDLTKRLSRIDVERDKYYNSLLNKLSYYDRMNEDTKLKKNWKELKFGEIYVYYDVAVFYCICMSVERQLFFLLRMNPDELKDNIGFFVFVGRTKDIFQRCCKVDLNKICDTGANIMTYWFNRDKYKDL